MKQWHVFGLVALCLMGSTTVGAQPPRKADLNSNPPEFRPLPPALPSQLDEEQLGKKNTQQSPYQSVTSFLYCSKQGDGRGAAFLLSGVDWQNANVDKIGELTGGSNKIDWRVDYDPAQSLVVNRPVGAALADAEEVTLTLKVGVRDAVYVEVSQEETVTLRREPTKGGPVWRIVPDKADEPATLGEIAFGKTRKGVIRTMVSYYANADLALKKMALNYSMVQVRQLGLGIFQYAEDGGEQFPPDAVTLAERITPYLRSKSVFTALGDPEGVQSYQYNPKIFGTQLGKIESPAEVVLLFMGKPDKLDFRYNGKTVVGYADGHVKAITEEEAKNLKWAP
jgi:prepilin-type processing-associated H-X9-DG protein